MLHSQSGTRWLYMYECIPLYIKLGTVNMLQSQSGTGWLAVHARYIVVYIYTSVYDYIFMSFFSVSGLRDNTISKALVCLNTVICDLYINILFRTVNSTQITLVCLNTAIYDSYTIILYLTQP